VSYTLVRFDLVSIRLAAACALTGSLTAAAWGSHLALAAASRRFKAVMDGTSAWRHTACHDVY